jgi:Escherichia/Staphylococcus phage prohead protease
VTHTLAEVLCRAEAQDGRRLGGYAAVFDQTTDLGWEGKERIDRKAFAAALADKTTDVRALFNHHPDHLLGRQSAGNLRLFTDSQGLGYEIDMPDTQLARDVHELARAGLIDGASFAFVPGEWEWDEKSQTRTHTSVARLVDVAPVTFPAYAGASTEARSERLAVAQRGQLIRIRHRVRTTGRDNR